MKNMGKRGNQMQEQVFSDKFIDDFKKKISERDIIDSEDITELKKLRTNSTKSIITYARLTTRAYLTFKVYLNQLESKCSLRKAVAEYIRKLDIESLDDLINNYSGGEKIGDHNKEERIKENIKENRNKYDKMISLFFKLFGEEDF